MIQNTHLSITLTTELRLERAIKEAGIDDPACVTKLSIAGTLFNDDFRYLCTNMRETLRELDLGDALLEKGRLNSDYIELLCGLVAITFPDTLTHIVHKEDKAICDVDRLRYMLSSSERCLTTIEVRPANRSFASEDGVLFNKNRTKLLYFPLARQGAYIIPDSMVEIGESAFYRSSITSVTIPKSVKKIRHSAFALSHLTSISIPDSVDDIESYAFFRSSLTSVHIPNSITRIRPWTFCECRLTSVTIPDSVEEIGKRAFECCVGLKLVTIPASVVEIEEYAFYDCPAFFTVHPNNPVYASENGLLYNKDKTKLLYESISQQDDDEVVVEDENNENNHNNNVSDINTLLSKNENDFRNFIKTKCKTLQELDLSNTSFKENRMTDLEHFTHLTSVILPKTIVDFQTAHFSIKKVQNLNTISVHPDNPVYASHDGVLFNKQMTELKYCPRGLRGSYVIPESVGVIRRNAFTDCIYLTSITFSLTEENVTSDSVVIIGLAAFLGCTGLTSITIPASVSAIPGYAFADCTNLISIVLSNSVTKIGSNAFADCYEIKSVIIPDSVMAIGSWAFSNCFGLTHITVPNSLQKIEDSTFCGCTGLTAINIPESVVEIGSHAFGDCTGLTSLFIPASTLEIDKEAFEGCDALIGVHQDNPVYTSKNGKLIRKRD